MEQAPQQTANFEALSDDLWISMSNYLEPYERFGLCLCCNALNGLFCADNYPFYSFYKSDINYWLSNIEWMTSAIDAKHVNELEPYAMNLYHFDSLSTNTLLSIKYFVIFYDKISGIKVNKRIEKIQYLLDSKYANDNIMPRLSQDENEEDVSLFDLNLNNDEDKSIDAQLKELDIDLNPDTEYLPSSIIHMYCHEISNKNQHMIQWICDILTHCDSSCSIFTETHFDKSNLDNESIDYLCNALQNRMHLRKGPLYSLKHVFFSGNTRITDDCIERLLVVLQQSCPQVVGINLDDTGITNKTCHIIHAFYMNADVFSTIKYIDLSNNNKIDVNGIHILNDIEIDIRCDYNLRSII